MNLSSHLARRVDMEQTYFSHEGIQCLNSRKVNYSYWWLKFKIHFKIDVFLNLYLSQSTVVEFPQYIYIFFLLLFLHVLLKKIMV